ncbi:MAG: M48 family metallopeptidase [Thermodesulfovibrionales bacterium]|nr:M48 family metallopeptidase [Thermodesulfovibrionales bacterium]
MAKTVKLGILFVYVILLFASCKEVPVTERKQLILIPESGEMKLGEDAFRKIIKESKLSNNRDIVDKVKKVGSRIAKASNRTHYKWEFIVIEDDSTANAFCLPGGKIGIYTGILPYTKDEKGLAAVIGHEVGHAIARHGAERMSTALLAQAGQIALNLIVDVDDPMVLDALNRAYGLGTEIGVILPFSRKQELEADRIGVSLMDKAEYNAIGALEFWKRMKQGRQGKQPLVYLSTHPVDDKRIAEIEKLLQIKK